MRNKEQQAGGAVDGPAAVEFIRPAGYERPLFRVMEDAEGGTVRTQFALRLSGVSYSTTGTENLNTQNADRHDSMRYVSSLLDGLEESDSIEVLCSTSRKPGRGLKNEWKMTGTAAGASREESMASAAGLFENVSVVLKTMKSEYQFAAVREDKGFGPDWDGYRWSAVIEPATAMISEKGRRSIGFITGEPGGVGLESVLLPMTAGRRVQGYLDSLYCGAPGGLKSVRLSLGVTAFSLTAQQQASLESMLAALRSGGNIVRITDNGKEEWLDKTQAARVVTALEPWVRDPSGYRVSCRVDSDGPVPLNLLSMIGKEIFQACRVPDVEDGMERCGEDGTAVDLSGCFHRGSVPVPLFPSAKVLAESGFRRQYGSGANTGASEGILLGRCGLDARSDSVYYPRGDRAKHCYIIGASGTGKSTLLYHMIMQDIANGEGVTLIDPHGDLYNQVLESVPMDRYGDVVLVNPCDFEYAVGINFLECSPTPFRSVEMNFIINEMIRIFDRLYDLRQTGGPIFEQYMRNALALLMEADRDNATLIDVPLIFEDRDFRKGLIDKCRNQTVKNFWSKQALQAGGEASLSNIAPYITSKLNQFTTNALLRPIIGQPASTINFRTILDEGKILLVNLSKGLLGELDTMLLGMLVIGKIFSSAMGRVSIPVEQRRQMFLYVDEFQNFTTETVSHMLSESRKFGISLTLANQNLSQLSEGHGRANVLNSVLGNVGTMLMFRMGVIDADVMQPYVKPSFGAGDLQELPDFHAIGRMLVHNYPQRPFVFNTMPMNGRGNSRDLPEIIDHLRKRYSRPTSEVERQINARLSQIPGS